MISLRFDKGSLLIRGEVGTPYGQWDPRVEAYRAMAIYYSDILNYLERSKIHYKDTALDPPPCPIMTCKIELRPYQKEALEAWITAKKRGVIVLPTGSGKTYIALKAIHLLNTATLIVVPTLDLLDQWRNLLSTYFNMKVGIYGGGEDTLYPLTVSTYDSAYLRAAHLGNKFKLLVFDEVHHLPAPSYAQIAEMYLAPYRMGLTATYEREDGKHIELTRLVGGQVYHLKVKDLVGKHLSPYTQEKLFVSLTPEEQLLYDKLYGVFTGYLRKKKMVLRGPKDFQRFIMRSGVDKAAREALLARNQAVKIALNSEEKMNVLGQLLKKYEKEKSLIFTLHNKLVYKISRRFLIPAITYQTPREERKAILEKFKAGKYEVVVTSQVLDEGVDVPDASICFILSGTGSTRAYIQRLGRILRKVKGKQAKLIEIVAKGTVETKISQRRHR